MFRRDTNANAQLQIRGGNTISRGGAYDLFKLVLAVEAECADIVIVIGLRDGALAFHWMHEAQLGVRQEFVDQPDFTQGCNIIMRDASFPEGFEQCR